MSLSTLIPDPIWEVFPNADSFENFKERVLWPIKLHENVPNDIKAYTATIGKLLEHSYFEYDFIEVATTEAIFTFEKALKLKWAEIHQKKTKKTLQELNDWFYENDYFECNYFFTIDQLRHIRNGKVHDTSKSTGGIAFLRKIYNVFNLINDLYVDRDLRIERKNNLKNLKNLFNQYNGKGLEVNDGSNRYCLDAVHPIFVNNTFENACLLTLVPLYGIESEKAEDVLKCLYIIKCTNWEITYDSFIGIDVETNAKITITSTEESRHMHNEWTNVYAPINITMMTDIYILDNVQDLFNFCWKNIHEPPLSTPHPATHSL